MKSTYRGVTYPSVFGWRPFFWLWRRFCCSREMHLLDEVEFRDFDGRVDHTLVCDACNLRINIAGFDCPHGWAAQTGGHPNDCVACAEYSLF